MSDDERKARERYDAIVETVRLRTEAGLTPAELRSVRDHVMRKMRERRAPRTRILPWLLPLTIATAAAAILLLVWPRAPVPAEPPVSAVAPQAVRVAVHTGEVMVAREGSAEEPVVLTKGARHELVAAREAKLDAGEVAFVVPTRPKDAQPFRVRVGHDEVVVYGAQFAVFAEQAALQRVSVKIGVVEVRLDDGASTHVLSYGQSFDRPPVGPAASPRPAHPHQPSLPARVRSGPARDLWEEATASLRAERCNVLRTQVAALVQQSQYAEDKAQALLLEAECAVRTRDKAEALVRYEKVAREYPWTASAETALFEVAVLQGDIGTKAQAMVSAEAYLKRYPQGRFADPTRFRVCEALLGFSATEARSCLEKYRRDFPAGVKSDAAADYLRRLDGAP